MKIYPSLSSNSYHFISVTFVAYSAWFFRFLKRKISIAFNAEEKTWPFEILEHYLEREIQEMLKIFYNKV